MGTLDIGAAGRISLNQNRSTYESILEQADQLAPRGQVRGQTYWIDAGPPRRVAFEAFQGIPDSSSVVVYDPTGTVGDLEGQDAYLFQDEVQSCIHLEGPWHHCWLD